MGLYDFGRSAGGTLLGQGGIDGSGTGLLFQGAGHAGAFMATQFLKLLPGGISTAFQTGLAGANLAGFFGEALAAAPLAGFKMKMLNVAKEIGNAVSQGWEGADQSAYNYGKHIGLAADQVVRLRDEMIRFGNAEQIGIKFGKSIEEAIKVQEQYAVAVGRNVRMTNEQIKNVLAMQEHINPDTAIKFAASLDNFGMSATDAGDLMGQMFNKSVKQGISLEKYAKNVADNIMLAQKYTFKNGINGLTSMAEKAAKLRIDMGVVAQLAENVSDIEKSVNVSSQLQVLGGPFSQFADPMKLLYGSLNDMEGLQDQLAELTKNLGYFNRRTGEIEIATFDKLRLKTAANAMGINYEKLIEQTTTAARRNEVEYQMRGLRNIPDTYKELIMNMATFENGVAGVRGKNGEFKALSKLASADFDLLVSNSQTDSENIAEITTMLRGMTDVKEGQKKAMDNLRAEKYAKQAEATKNIYDMIGSNAQMLNRLIQLQMGVLIWNSVGAPLLGGVSRFGKGMLGSMMTLGGVRGFAKGGYTGDGDPNEPAGIVHKGETVMTANATALFGPLLMMMNRVRGGLNMSLEHMYGYGMTPMNGAAMGGFRSPYGLTMNLSPKDRKTIQNMFATMSRQNAAVSQQNVAVMKSARRMMMTQSEQNALMARAYRIKNPHTFKSSAMRFMSKPGTGIAGSALLTGGMMGLASWQQSKMTGENIMDKGRARGKAIGMAVGGTAGAAAGMAAGAAIGASLGTVVPGIGNIIGGILGAAIGALGGWLGKEAGGTIGGGSQTRRNRKYNEFMSDIKNPEASARFSTLQGNFSTSEMEKIKNALSNNGVIDDYELDEDLRKKLEMSGNSRLFSENIKKHHDASPVGPNEFVWIGEGGEGVINSKMYKMSKKLVGLINKGVLNDSHIKPVEPMGKQMKVNGNSVIVNNGAGASNQINIKPIDININGSLKLEAEGVTRDIMDELMGNQMFVSKIADILTKQFNLKYNIGYDKQSMDQKYITV